jgi:hypothetical protein
MLFALAIATNQLVARAAQRVNYVPENSLERSGTREVASGGNARFPAAGGRKDWPPRAVADSGARVIYVVCFSATAALIPSARSSRVSSLNRSI